MKPHTAPSLLQSAGYRVGYFAATEDAPASYALLWKFNVLCKALDAKHCWNTAKDHYKVTQPNALRH